MTYSIIAAEPEQGRLGVAIASRFLAVGSYCLYLDAAAGAVITQSIANPIHGRDGLAGLARGQEPREVLAALLAADPHADWRQTHLMNPAGGHAVHSGRHCGAWAGALEVPGASLAGNLLAGEQVLDAMGNAWLAAAAEPMAERLLQVLAAGELAGGDWRGMQAAAIRVCCGEIHPELDLRVDDCASSPVDELRRLYQRHQAADVQTIRSLMPRWTRSAVPEYPPMRDLASVMDPDPDRD